MRIKEYGDASNQAIMLIHGGGAGPWMFEAEAELLKDRYHVILPTLDGHAGDVETFVSSSASAAKLVDYVLEKLDGKLLLVGGASLGAQTALEVVTDGRIKVELAILESGIYFSKHLTACVSSFPPLIKYSMKLYDNKKQMDKSYASLGWDNKFYDDYVRTGKQLSFESSRNLYRSYFDYQTPATLSALDTRFMILHGGAETKIILDDAKALSQRLKNCGERTFEGYHHCEFCINHPEEYAALVEKLAEEQLGCRTR